jgi:hypothetical protein
MAITNINTLQKLAYTSTGRDLQTYGDLYLKQSLSNLGQRFSIKGDGVSTGTFSIYELFDGMPAPTPEDFHNGGKLYSAYMKGVVKPTDDEYNITLTAYNVGETVQTTIDLNANNYVVLDEDLYIETTRAHNAETGDTSTTTLGKEICYYGKGGIITVNNNIYSVMLGTFDKDKNLLSITVDEYDITNNRLIDGVHINFNFPEYSPAPLSLHRTYYVDSKGNKQNYKYTQYYIQEDNENVTDKSKLKEIYDWLLNETTSPVMTNKSGWTIDTVIGQLDLSLVYNTEYSIDVDKTPADYLFYTVISETTGLNGFRAWELLEWNETFVYILPKFKECYTEHQYFSGDDNQKLKRRVVAEIFTALYNNFMAESNGDNANDVEFPIYIPYEYAFIYTCNSNNTSQIFSSTRDVVTESAADPTEEMYKIWQTGTGVRQQLFICPSWNDATSTEDIFSVWEYSVTYDDDNIIKGVKVERTFVLPYINDDGYWNINNVNTSVYARGKDGGQPSLIISYSDTAASKHEILSTMNRDELSTALQWEPVEYRVRPLDAIIGDSTYHMLSAYIPVNITTSYLSENLVTFLENAIIMSIGSVHGETDKSTVKTPLSDTAQLGADATVTTFWALKKDKQTDKYSFSYVIQPDSAWSLDFNYLGDAEAIAKYYLKSGVSPDRYEHSWLVYKRITNAFKNVGDVICSYPVLMNRDKEYFTDLFPIAHSTSDTGKYSNEANFVPSFVTDVTKEGSYITGVTGENEKKYFHFDNNGSYNHVPVVQTHHNEWYPNTHIKNSSGWVDTLLPTLDLKEMFVRNVNTLNRYNVLSTDADGKMYYAYYGTSFDDADKSVLRLGTGVEDVNLGLKTLTTEEERKKFNKHRKLSVEFDDIVLNGRTSVSDTVWNKTKITDNITVCSTLYTPVYAISYNTSRTWPVLAEISEGAAYDLFNIDTTVSSKTDINQSVSIEKKSTYIAYLNLNRMLSNKLGIDPIRQLTGNNIYNNGSYYYLRLTSNINDFASQLYDQGSYFITILNPLGISYYTYSDTDLVSTSFVNIRELPSSLSTTYTLFDGGAL